MAGPDSEGVVPRRSRERPVWSAAFLLSVLVHFLLLVLWPSGRIEVASAPAGAEARPDSPAEGRLEIVSLAAAASPPPELPPETPDPDRIVPVPDVVVPEIVPQVETTPPEVPEPGIGTADGPDAEARGDAGSAGDAGSGDAGAGGDGVARSVPPSPRGLIIPPTNRDLRGREVEVWVFVDAGGRVVADSTQLRPPTPDRRFNEQLLREAAQWSFQPAREDGVPVAAWFPYVIGLE